MGGGVRAGSPSRRGARPEARPTSIWTRAAWSLGEPGNDRACAWMWGRVWSEDRWQSSHNGFPQTGDGGDEVPGGASGHRVARRVRGVLHRHRDDQAASGTWPLTCGATGGWVFASPVGDPVNPATDYDEWKRLLALAGIRDGRLHDARHTAATVLLILGVPERAVMELMGWASSSDGEAVSAYDGQDPSGHRPAGRRSCCGMTLKRPTAVRTACGDLDAGMNGCE